MTICRIDRELSAEEPILASMFASHAALAARNEVDSESDAAAGGPHRRRVAATAAAWAAGLVSIALAVGGATWAVYASATGLAHVLNRIG